MSETDKRQEESAQAAEKSGNPVKEMFLLAALYLPLGFFLWFFMASGLMFPASRLAEWLLTGLYPDYFSGIFQAGYIFEMHSPLTVTNPQDGRLMQLTWDINPMIYAWGMALLFGLIMATPMSALRRVLQMLVALVVVTFVTVWGVFWEAWRDLAFVFGPEIGEAARQSGLSPTAIALCYQLGYLMFPGVIPIAAWILMNRPFIEKLVEHRRI